MFHHAKGRHSQTQRGSNMRKNWVIKSISIEVADAEIASRVGNLSKFVRVCLRRWAAFEEQKGMHKTPGVLDRLGVCLPSSGCIVCWPSGAPPEAAWAQFMGINTDTTSSTEYTGPEVGDLEVLRAQIPEIFSISEIQSKGNEPVIRSPPKKKSRSLISRALKFLGK